jgi:opacity protein-like surface antigen
MRLQNRLALSMMALALLPLAPATAADYDPPIAIDAVDEYVPVEVGSGWYLRGDVGYALQTDTDLATYRTFNPITATYGQASFDTSSLDSEFIFGGGIGYRYNDWIRGDATIDGFRSKFSGTTSSATPCLTTGPIGTSCRSEDGSTVSAISFMGNGYIDLGTYVGITPYVGAGAGMSYLSWSGLNSQSYCVGGACTGTPIAPTANSGVKDWRFTYALMAGVAYDLTRNLKLDLGYKYRDIDDGTMFGWDAGSTAAGATGAQGSDQGLTQHEVKVGLRYELW